MSLLEETVTPGVHQTNLVFEAYSCQEGTSGCWTTKRYLAEHQHPVYIGKESLLRLPIVEEQ